MMMTFSTLREKFSLNWIALALLLIGFAFSAVRFFYLQTQLGDSRGEENPKVINLAHWQLEPGYRDALNWAIGEFHRLPEVVEAGITIKQMAITERVYNQFMNVHLISGTAPDMAAVGGVSQLTRNNAVAKFYAPLGRYASEPNPYNAEYYLAPDLNPELKEMLRTSDWKDTFFDGMQGGWSNGLNEYFSVPISSFGKKRIFYNRDWLLRGKQFLREAYAQQPRPAWLQACERDGESGYLPFDSRLEAWLENDEIPDTLGQCLLFARGIQQLAAQEELSFLVPFSSSKYGGHDTTQVYRGIMMTSFQSSVDPLNQIERGSYQVYAAWQRGVWAFDSPAIREFYRLAEEFIQFYPAGYTGLDREQGQRRFILGNAAMVTAYGWDASSIFSGVEKRDDPEDRFEVIVARQPLPGPGERWQELLPAYISEADVEGGVPIGINQQSKNFKWALAFLQFLTSQPVNDEFNRRAGWLPVTLGAHPPDRMEPFMPIVEGLPEKFMMKFAEGDMPSGIRNKFSGLVKLHLVGKISYEELVEEMNQYLEHPRQGANSVWANDLQRAKDNTRSQDRVSSVLFYLDTLEPGSVTERRLVDSFFNGLVQGRRFAIRREWQDLNPEEPFPEF